MAAVDADQWTDVGCIATTSATQNRPTASYRVHEETVSLYEKPYRSIVVHFSAHDKRRLKRLERDDSYSAEKILQTYKDQHASENNFDYLKDEQIVNAIFLNQPERIEALGSILLISLLIWRLIEQTIRTERLIDNLDNFATIAIPLLKIVAGERNSPQKNS